MVELQFSATFVEGNDLAYLAHVPNAMQSVLSTSPYLCTAPNWHIFKGKGHACTGPREGMTVQMLRDVTPPRGPLSLAMQLSRWQA